MGVIDLGFPLAYVLYVLATAIEAKSHGYIRNYRGIRISSTGQRFWIEDVILWDVLDENYQRCGQAATFSDWKLVGDLRET